VVREGPLHPAGGLRRDPREKGRGSLARSWSAWWHNV
jgi:hypothetical protein